MAISPSKTDREFQKFRDGDNPGETKVAVVVEQGGSPIPVEATGSTVKIQATNGDSTTATSLGDLNVADVPNQTGLNIQLSLTTTAVEGKVGASTMTNRKYIEMLALTTGVKWGYSTDCLFDLYKNQFFSLPAGTNCKVYFKASSGTADVVVGEK